MRNILDFERDYPDAHVVTLEQNYRSTGTILRAANAVIAQNPHRHPKRLWTDLGDGRADHRGLVPRRARGGPRRGRRRSTRALARGSSAVARSPSSTAPTPRAAAIEDQLVRRQVPYIVVGGPRFYERAEVRDLLAYLRVVANPADGVSLARMLGAPKRGLGPGAIAKLEAFADRPRPAGRRRARRTPRGAGAPAGASAPTWPRRARWWRTRASVAEAGSPLDRILETVLDRSGLRDALVREGTFEAQGRVENLEEMVRVAAEYEGSEEDADAGRLPGGHRPPGRRRPGRRPTPARSR